MLRHFPWALGMGFRAAPVETIVRVATLLIRFTGPSLVLLMLQRVIEAVAAQSGLAGSLSALAAACILTEVGTATSKNFDTRIQEKMEPFLHELVLRRAATLTAEQFDDPATHDLIDRVAGGSGRCLYELMSDTLWFLAVLAGCLSTVAVLLTTSPWAALAGCLAAVPVSWAGARNGTRLHKLERHQTPARRFTEYLARLLATREPAAEMRAYALEEHFLGRWRQAFARRRAEYLTQRWQGVWEGWVAGAGMALLFGLALVTLALQARSGRVSAGDFVVIVGALRLLQASMTNAAASFGQVWQISLPAQELRSFLALPPAAAPGTRPFPGGPIRFEHVSYTYPGSTKPVLHDLSLTIKPGESVALVGVNGAGKSTLVKLMLGLYRPTAGRITYGGVDLAEIDPSDLHRHLACVFQDFVRYELPLRENIRFGRLSADDAELSAAAEQAGIGGIPLDTMLGRTFTGGVGLSGGQWQRIAIARAFVRTAPVILLDEPAAALDPRAEVALFGQFLDLVRGRTALLISHRLGSARLADRVIVLSGGRITEDGTHDELLVAGGEYARLFQLQASWYEEEVAVC
ncbi:MAG TPA: ABC transporter ATP-binding protein [Symbiobacteriaceae bacterium]|nr:ABC transporter ATP-binding protein [Symbiobacteriaceae bacterium]